MAEVIDQLEQEMRALPERERRFRADHYLPIVEALAASEQGRRDLAAICSAYLKEHRPETEVTDAPAPPPRKGESDGAGRAEPEPERGGGPGRRRPRRRRRSGPSG